MIDIRTFMLVLAIGNISFAMLMAGYARTADDNPAMRVWIWARLVQGCAHLLNWWRPELPQLGGALAANLTLILGAAVEFAAYCTFFGLPGWRRWLYPATALALVVVGAAIASGAAGSDQAVLVAAILALYCGAMAAILLRTGRRTSALQRLIGANDLVLCVAMCWRAWAGLADRGLTAVVPGPGHSFAYLTAYLLLIVNGFGFLLLCKQKEDQRMLRLASIDSLTGLVNRRAFFDRTERERALARRLKQPIGLMMIDIDHFKGLNDRFGHATGDEALCVFAATAQTALREHDIMGRLGGEEFAVVLPGTDLEGALQAAERLRMAVAGAVLTDCADIYSMTVSIGVVLIDPNEHIKAALARADHALYAAKSAGRNRVEVGEPELRIA